MTDGFAPPMRDLSLDCMRVFGVLIIIVAHSDPPLFVAQIRNFGTPLLIVVSGLAHAHIYASRRFSTKDYLGRRLRRLIIPAWIFLTFFFGAFLAADLMLGKEFPFEPEQVLTTYTFYGGIGYVWIFKVYVFLALMTPAALRLAATERSNTLYLTVLMVALLAHEALLDTVRIAIPGTWLEFCDTMFFVLVPYAVFYMYGMRLRQVSHRTTGLIGVGSLLLFVLLAVGLYVDTGAFVPTQTAKYPPRLYYLAYALAAVNFCYLAFARWTPTASARDMIVWLSSSALWIYLWHILAIFVWGYLIGAKGPGYGWSIVMILVLVVFGIIATAFQQFIVRRFLADSRSVLGRKIGRLLI